MRYLLLLVLVLLAGAPAAHAAVGCTLSNPAEDLKYLFPELSTYKEEVRNLSAMPEGKKWYAELKERLGSDLDPIYEGFETPYTLYTVFKGETLIGVVHGVNVPGRGGVIQIFLSVDPQSGEIKSFFFQRIESAAAKELRAKAFRSQFNGLSLADFYKHDYYAAVKEAAGGDKLAAVKAPEISAEGLDDYHAALRGIRKNLVLLDLFFFNRKFEPYFERAVQALRQKNSHLGG